MILPPIEGARIISQGSCQPREGAVTPAQDVGFHPTRDTLSRTLGAG